MATLNLPDDVRSAVWRALKARLSSDPALAASELHLAYPDGSDDVTRDLESWAGGVGVVKFFPALGNQAWFTEGSQYGNLMVYVDALLPRADFEDQANLQGAIESALNTIAGVDLQAALVSAGAVTGLVLFTQPLNQVRRREGKDNVYRLTGQFVVEVERRLLL